MLKRVFYEGVCLTRRAGFPLCYPFLERFERKAYKFRTRMMEGVMRSDAVVLSYPKSGRTWVEVMLSRLFQMRLGLAENEVIEFSSAFRAFPAIPRLFFTHDDFHVLEGNEFLPEGGPKGYFADAKTLFVVRHPLDVVVSMYFQQSKRSGYVEGVDIYEFATEIRGGLPTIIDFMNLWATLGPKYGDHHMVRYEDLRADPFPHFKSLSGFLGFDFTDDEIREAIDFSSFDNMKKREAENFYDGDFRVSAGDPDDSDSFKARRGVVGGYTDYFTDAQIETLSRLVVEDLDPVYGYGTASASR
jgi:hypothetical protein